MLVETLSHESPMKSLLKISEENRASAERLAHQLAQCISSNIPSDIPTLRQDSIQSSPQTHHPQTLLEHQEKFHSRSDDYDTTIQASLACSESILAAIGKVASGGSQTSAELRELESQRRSADVEAQDIEAALLLRQCATAAAEALETRRLKDAANAVRDFRSVEASEQALTLAGPHTLRAYDSVREALQKDVLERYSTAVNNGDLGAISDLTPLISILELSEKGVELYLRFVKSLILKSLDQTENRDERPGSKLANIYNSAVTVLRHHLPMVAFLLGDAGGDVALIHLVHAEVENRVVPIFDSFIKDKKLSVLHDGSNKFVTALEDRYTSGNDWGDDKNFHDLDDCGFQKLLGNLSDADAFVENMALVLQYTESYNRFLHHAIDEINKARALRYKQKRDERRRKFLSTLERDGKELTSAEERKFDADEEIHYQGSLPQNVLSSKSRLLDVVTELGGYYSALERSVLLGTMQRAFLASVQEDKSFSSVNSLKTTDNIHSSGSRSLQTSLLEGSFYAAQRSTLRAFATGHTQAAAAAANFCSDAIGRFLLEVMIRRCEASTSALRPGDGLLPGQGGIGQAALAVVTTAQKGLSKSTGASTDDKNAAKQKLDDEIARACSTFNDLELAVDYVQKLEQKLLQEIASSYPQGHETDQLVMCVKSIGVVTEAFRNASDQCIGQLGNTVLPRVRSIVTEIIGQESVTASSFSTVMSGSSLSSNTFKLNYELDDLGYQLSQISEGYVSKLCALLDDFILQLRFFLCPRLADVTTLAILSTVCKRLESSLKKCTFTPLGSLAFDSDFRALINFFRERLASIEFHSNVALYKVCNPASRMAQISLLMNVDDIEDVVDLISSAKSKGSWDLSLNDAKAFLCLRSDFDSKKVHELLRGPNEEKQL